MEDMTSAVYEFAQKHFTDYKVRNGQLVIRTCPFCDGGTSGDEWTFAIGLDNGCYSCLRGHCEAKGTFRQLSNMYGEVMSESILKKIPSFEKKKDYTRPNESDIRPLTAEAIQYFARRGISEDTLKAYRVGCDVNGDILFPFYRNNTLIFEKFRKPRKHTKEDGPKEWSMRNGEPILFGMDNVSYNKPLYITEGEIDAMSLYEAGVTNVVSVPCGCNNMEWIQLCWEWLEKFEKEIIVFGDNDAPGAEMSMNVVKRIGEDRCCNPPEYPEFVYEGHAYGRLCKDANEILLAYGPDRLKEVATSFEPVAVKGILNLAEVQFIDPSTIPRIYTTITDLDDIIGGFAPSSVTLITGKRGAGKSTINGNFLLNAIQQGHKVCAYSGELSSTQFLNWIMTQATESRYLTLSQDKISGKTYVTVPRPVQSRIREWIDGKFFLYDNGVLEDNKQEDSVMKIFSVCARRYGVDVFLIDNIMSILSDAEEETKAQAKFMSRLKAFATKFNATVICVAHPRKTMPSQKGLTNDDVSGASALTNLADTVIAVSRGKLSVLKNRAFGTLADVVVDYNKANRRIYSSEYGDKYVYSWDHDGIEVPEIRADQDPNYGIDYGTVEEGGAGF